MGFINSIHTIDSHTMGEPTRIVVSGLPNIKGKTMYEKKTYLEETMDYIRTGMMHEPRGHRDMFGSIITHPTNPEADLGIIFMDGGGYLNMCGHGSIGAATVAVETGMVPMVEPYTNIILEAPAGLINARVLVENGQAKEVSIVNVPSFLYRSDIEINIPEIGRVLVDISFGGSFFALVRAEDLGIDIMPENGPKLVKYGMEIKDAINKIVAVQHPTLPHIKTVDLVEIYGPAKNPMAHLQNVVIFGDGQIDRSPCGTGTSAKMAALYAKGELALEEPFIYESITGTMFRGRALEETKIGDFLAIFPEITGSAYITGFNHFVFDENDPLKYGFII